MPPADSMMGDPLRTYNRQEADPTDSNPNQSTVHTNKKDVYSSLDDLPHCLFVRKNLFEDDDFHDVDVLNIEGSERAAFALYYTESESESASPVTMLKRRKRAE